jgi:prepilin-type N-terminal cleavage/methylation domain-containing protein
LKKSAFTLIELIFAIVIIGVLASIAIPKFKNLSGNSKVSAELSTASSVQTSIDACHGEWIVNEGNFTCGASISSSDLNEHGYPDALGDSNDRPLNKILKNADNINWSKNGSNYYGPASNSSSGTSNCKANKPCVGKFWEYNSTDGTFVLKN